uniref:Uncharacterized protein n=2 Tax=Macrostomum lignano TaxID=282301 RepID=A0A1I8HI24_9PLAT
MESRLKKLVVARSRRHTVVKPPVSGSGSGGGEDGTADGESERCASVPNSRMSKSSCDLSDLSKSKLKGNSSGGGGSGGAGAGNGGGGGAKERSSSRGRL